MEEGAGGFKNIIFLLPTSQFSPHTKEFTAAGSRVAIRAVELGLVCATGAQPGRDTWPENGNGGTKISRMCLSHALARYLKRVISNYTMTPWALYGSRLSDCSGYPPCSWVRDTKEDPGAWKSMPITSTGTFPFILQPNQKNLITRCLFCTSLFNEKVTLRKLIPWHSGLKRATAIQYSGLKSPFSRTSPHSMHKAEKTQNANYFLEVLHQVLCKKESQVRQMLAICQGLWNWVRRQACGKVVRGSGPLPHKTLKLIAERQPLCNQRVQVNEKETLRGGQLGGGTGRIIILTQSSLIHGLWSCSNTHRNAARKIWSTSLLLVKEAGQGPSHLVFTCSDNNNDNEMLAASKNEHLRLFTLDLTYLCLWKKTIET